ncbi:MAG: TetR family transcriptional regulator [Nodosilinea sp.]
MAAQRKSARQRLVDAAFQLFSNQGVAATTTRQVADLADVNEVTLFRQFGSKHGLLSAIMEEAEVLANLDGCFDREALGQQPSDQALRTFLTKYLDTLDQLSELVRSVVGEAGQFSLENQQAVGRGVQNVHQFTVDYFNAIWPQGAVPGSSLTTADMASLVTALLVGYAAIDGTTAYHGLWPSRDALVDKLVRWLLAPQAVGGESWPLPADPLPLGNATDLPAPVVHQIMQAARKAGIQPYALVYVLFGAGLSPEEIAQLKRVNAVYDQRQHILQVGASPRQVPLNQWILGYRYGTYTKNPLTRWLKSRSDSSGAMFLGPAGQPITPVLIRQLWADVTANITAPAGHRPTLEQARITWCVDMLLKGLDGNGLSLLTQLTTEQLTPLMQKAEERRALEQALRLDRGPGLD